MAELLNRSGARVLITAGPELAPQMWANARDLAGQLDAILVLRPTGAAGAPGPLPVIDGVRTGYLSQLAAGGDTATFAGEPPQRSDLAGFFHTGGTTGIPKIAAHTQANEVADAWMLAASSLLDADSVVFAALPLFHVNALVVTLLAPLFKGQHVVWAGPLGYREPDLYREFWKITENYQITAMSAVPTVYSALAQCPVDADISSLQHAMVGASPLPPAVRAAFHSRTGVSLLEGYGLTEATCVSTRNFPHVPRPGSVGLPLPYQQVKVIDPVTRRDQPAGETGVLAISGPAVFAGYVTGRDADGYVLDGLGTLDGGWLDTGDLASIGPGGFVYLAGRAKDLIIRGGHNIDPAVIEDTLLRHPQVTAASAVGHPDVHAGEVPVAYVTLAPGAAVTEEELRTRSAAAPKTVTVLDTLPVTAVGKPYKLALRADAARRAVADALTGLGDGIAVDAVIDDGSVAVAVTLAPGTDQAAAKATLDQYTIRWTLAVRP